MNSKIKTLLRKRLPFAAIIESVIRHGLSRRKIRGLLERGSAISIEVGAGDKSGSGGWTTIDITGRCDVYWDLRRGIPFPNESVERIYSSHFFEHLSFPEIQKFLGECKRVLVPGGRFLICVPNARIYIDAYANGVSLDPAIFFAYKPAYDHTTRIDYVNYMAYMAGQHKYMFDEENLVAILRSSGFENVRLRQFDPSLDLKERDYESVYAEAEK